MSRAGLDQAVLSISRDGSGWDGSGRVRRSSNLMGRGRLNLTRSDPREVVRPVKSPEKLRAWSCIKTRARMIDIEHNTRSCCYDSHRVSKSFTVGRLGYRNYVGIGEQYSNSVEADERHTNPTPPNPRTDRLETKRMVRGTCTRKMYCLAQFFGGWVGLLELSRSSVSTLLE